MTVWDFEWRRGLEVGCEGGDVGRVCQGVDGAASESGGGAGGDQPGLQPVEEFAGWVAGHGGGDVGVDHHEGVGAGERHVCAELRRVGSGWKKMSVYWSQLMERFIGMLMGGREENVPSRGRLTPLSAETVPNATVRFPVLLGWKLGGV